MGLDTSHDCWSGSYGAFMRWRSALAQVCGIDIMKMQGYQDDGGGLEWESLRPDPLHILLHHSDCDGEIAVMDCVPIAERLEQLIPDLEKYDAAHEPAGHLSRSGTAGAARRFADGLRRAAEAGEPVEFH